MWEWFRGRGKGKGNCEKKLEPAFLKGPKAREAARVQGNATRSRSRGLPNKLFGMQGMQSTQGKRVTDPGGDNCLVFALAGSMF